MCEVEAVSYQEYDRMKKSSIESSEAARADLPFSTFCQHAKAAALRNFFPGCGSRVL